MIVNVYEFIEKVGVCGIIGRSINEVYSEYVKYVGKLHAAKICGLSKELANARNIRVVRKCINGKVIGVYDGEFETSCDAFLNAMCGKEIKRPILEYVAWCSAHDEKPVSGYALIREMKRRGLGIG